MDFLYVGPVLRNGRLALVSSQLQGLFLALTGSKSVSMVLWAVGGVYAFIWLVFPLPLPRFSANEDSVLIYLEYGEAFPFTGGELIYVRSTLLSDLETANTLSLTKWAGHDCCFTILISSYFLILWNSSPNSFAFSKHTLLAALPWADHSSDFDPRLVKILCLGNFDHYLSSSLLFLASLGYF